MVAALAAGLALAGSQTLLVLNKAEDTVWLINAETGAPRAKLATGPNPNEVAVSPDGKTAAISDMGGGQRGPGKTLTFVDIPAGKVTRQVDVMPHGMAHGVVWLSSSRIAFTSHLTDSVNEFDVATGKVVRSISTGQKGTHLAVFSKDQARCFAVNAGSGSISVIDFKKGEVLKQIPTGARAEGISLSPDGTLLACGNVGANSVSIIDTQSLEVVKTLEAIGGPIRTTFSADGSHLLVSSLQPGSVEVFKVKDWAKAATIDLKQKPIASEAYGAQWPTPMNFHVRKSGRILVVLVTSHAIAEIDPNTWKVARTYDTGGIPDGLAVAEG